MSETATPEAVQTLRDAINTADSIRWASEDLDRQGVRAAIIPLPDTAPKTGDWCDENWAGGTIIPTPHGPNTVAFWSGDVLPDEDNPEMVITYEAAAALLPQLARLVTDHEAKQAAARDRRIAEYAAAMHAASDLCLRTTTPEVCGFCVQMATYAIDNPPPAA